MRSLQDFDYGALAGLERFSINNLGDPFIESNYGVHSREFEVRNTAVPTQQYLCRNVSAVLQACARLQV